MSKLTHERHLIGRPDPKANQQFRWYNFENKPVRYIQLNFNGDKVESFDVVCHDEKDGWSK